MKSAWRVLRDAFDRLTIYLPIILTAVLALGTYWLVRNAPEMLAPRPAEARRMTPTTSCAASR